MRSQNRVLCAACITILLVCVLGCAGLPKSGQTGGMPPPADEPAFIPIPDELKEKISLSEKLGAEIYINEWLSSEPM
jgi:hypothetical protein